MMISIQGKGCKLYLLLRNQMQYFVIKEAINLSWNCSQEGRDIFSVLIIVSTFFNQDTLLISVNSNEFSPLFFVLIWLFFLSRAVGLFFEQPYSQIITIQIIRR